MTKRRSLFLLLSVSMVTFFGCQMDEAELKTATLDVPENLDQTEALFLLGKALFYDPKMSANNSVSCASCHTQSAAFSDNARFSRGFDNRLTHRNSMPIQNLFTFFEDGGFNNGFINNGIIAGPTLLFWDGRETDLNQMVLRPLVNHVEMGVRDVDALAAKMGEMPHYKALFEKAFLTEQATSSEMAQALAFFISRISSQNTHFDKVQRGEAELNSEQQIGMALFFEKYDCNSCHQVQTPSGYLVLGGGFSNIGLDKEYTDEGLAQVTKRPEDVGKFKIPSLRNVALTAPYMHDGRFETLEDVMEHYSTGVQDHPNLDERLKTADDLLLHITPQEKKAIIAFLHTLTDTEMVTNPIFANPFQIK